MGCYKEFPRRIVIYNDAAMLAFLFFGGMIIAGLGLWALPVYLLVLTAAFTLTFWTICSRCSYYGLRCGLGFGLPVKRLFKKRNESEFMHTGGQYLAGFLLAIGFIFPLVAGVLSVIRGVWLWPALFLASLLALIIPHPKMVCRRCRQRESGACGIGVLITPKTGHS